jgi:hypothetical protein
VNFTLDVAGAPFARFRTTPNAALDPLAEARGQPLRSRTTSTTGRLREKKRLGSRTYRTPDEDDESVQRLSSL